MSIDPNHVYAVLTGDVVGSSKLAPETRQVLPELLKKAAGELRAAFPGASELDIDVFRGDSWQMLLWQPERCVRHALFLRCRLRGFAESGRGIDTRIGLGIGSVERMPAQRASEGDGDAYRASGSALDELSNGRSYRTLTMPTAPESVAVALGLIDAVAQGWSARQARAVGGALLGQTQEQIGKTWPEPITQQGVKKHLDAARWPAVEEGIAFIEKQLVQLSETQPRKVV